MHALKKFLGMEGFRYSPWQFATFRIVFGLYLVWHFALLIPYAAELFSSSGSVPDPMLQKTYAIFPNILNLIEGPIGVTLFVATLTILAGLFTAGYRRRLVSLLLWYGWACLFNRNNFIANPGLPMIGWLLLAISMIPRGEPLSIDERKDDWHLPNAIYWGAWLIVGIGYTISGLHKYSSPSWYDGTAIHKLMDNPLARVGIIRDIMSSAPDIVFTIQTYFSLALEILFLPLVLFRKTRFIAWLAILGMHFGILSMINFTDLTLGVVMFHLFTFDPRWIPAKKSEGPPVLFFDGVCGLCNSVVDFVIAEDTEHMMRFSPLQGEHAEKVLPVEYKENLSTLIVHVNDQILKKSRAVIFIGETLGGMWRVFATAAKIIPQAVADPIYDLVAKNRYRLFGKKETCRLPSPQERQLFV